MPGSIDGGNTNDTSLQYYPHNAQTMKDYENNIKSRSGDQTSTSNKNTNAGSLKVNPILQVSSGQTVTTNTNLPASAAQNVDMTLLQQVKNPWLTKVNFPKNKEVKRTVLLAAYLATIPYSHDVDENDGKLTRAPDWALSKDLMKTVTYRLKEKEAETKKKTKLFTKKGISRNRASSIKLKTLNGNAVITDKKTGLVLSILENKDQKEICISFGGTTSGKGAGGLRQRSIANLSIALKQWGANLKNTMKGEMPDCYQQAVEITAQIKAIIASTEKYTDYKLNLTGHSLGGGMAQFAAAMNYEQDKPIKAICFSSAELGREMQTQIAEHLELKGHGAKEKTLNNINHYHIKGDPVPQMHRLFGHLTNIGTTSSIPPEPYLPTDVLLGNSNVGRHDKFFKHFYQNIEVNILAPNPSYKYENDHSTRGTDLKIKNVEK